MRKLHQRRLFNAAIPCEHARPITGLQAPARREEVTPELSHLEHVLAAAAAVLRGAAGAGAAAPPCPHQPPLLLDDPLRGHQLRRRDLVAAACFGWGEAGGKAGGQRVERRERSERRSVRQPSTAARHSITITHPPRSWRGRGVWPGRPAPRCARTRRPPHPAPAPQCPAAAGVQGERGREERGRQWGGEAATSLEPQKAPCDCCCKPPAAPIRPPG